MLESVRQGIFSILATIKRGSEGFYLLLTPMLVQQIRHPCELPVESVHEREIVRSELCLMGADPDGKFTEISFSR